MKKLLIMAVCLFLSFMLFSCSSSSEKTKDDGNGQNQETETSSDINGAVNVDPSFLTTPYKAKAMEDMEIYSDTFEDSSLKGYVRKDDKFEVFEVKQDGENIWCRIANGYWINNKGASLLEKIPDDENIVFIHDEISFIVYPDTLIGVFYERFCDGVPIEDERQYADFVDSEYDNQGRLVKETLTFGNRKEVFTYYYDSENNSLHVIIEMSDEGDEWVYDEYRFTFDALGKILTESSIDQSGAPYLSIEHVYDENGNIIQIIDDRNQVGGYSRKFEYNGNVRFEYNSIVEDDIGYSKDSFVFRYDDKGELIETFFASKGDIRNEIGGYK